MTLTPTDMFAIQAAIDAYENKFPRRPSPSAGEALAWQAGNRKVKLRPDERTQTKSDECGVWSWAWERLLVRLRVGRGPKD